MTRIVTASELARRTAQVLDAVAAGEHLVIERHGKAIARLGPTTTPGRTALGTLADRARQVVDDDDLLGPIPDWSAK